MILLQGECKLQTKSEAGMAACSTESTYEKHLLWPEPKLSFQSLQSGLVGEIR